MSELITIAAIDASAERAARENLDPDECLRAFPAYAHADWLNRYYRAVESLQREAA